MQNWLAAGRLTETQRAELQTRLAELVALYEAHIRLEEERVFVLASRALNADQLREIGAEMRRRRVAAHVAGPARVAPTG